MKSRLLILCIIFLAGPTGLFAQTYALKSSIFSNGAETSQSTSYKLKATIGQDIVGNATSTSYRLETGFEPSTSGLSELLPDLVFLSPNINPATVAPGQVTAATFIIKNTGDADITSAIAVKAYLSANSTYEPGDLEIASFSLGTFLAKNGQISFPQSGQGNSIIVPACTTIGSYQIILFVDPSNTIVEKNESNNTSAQALAVSNTSGGGVDTTPPTFGTITKPNLFTVGAPVSLSNVTDQSGIKEVLFFHRTILASDFSSPETTIVSATTYSQSLQSGWADELGVEFYFKATDNAGNSSETQHQFLSVVTPDNLSIPTLGSGGEQGDYRMFSIPYKLDKTSIADVFGPVLGGTDKTKWRLFHYQNGRYTEYPDNLTNIESGNGYWFNTKDKAEIVLGSGVVADANQSKPFTRILEKGWNQIGNPYPFNIKWSTITAANAAAGLNSLWLFEGGSYLKKDVLAIWKGAFVFSDNGGPMTIPVSTKTTDAGRIALNTLLPRIDEDSWKLSVTLSLGDMEQIAAVGMHPDASSSKDHFDEISLPRFINYLEMNTNHKEFFAPCFSEDVVPTQAKEAWEFALSSSQHKGTATLRWDQPPIAGAHAQLVLLNLQDQVLVDMKSTGEYVFDWSEGRKFKILYSKDGEVMPGVTLLGNAYPNPFRGNISIPVLLAEDQSAIQIQVYDLMGRKVKTISKEAANAGVHTLTWDGQNEQGYNLESGLYLYQLSGDQGILSAPRRIIKQ